MFSQHDCGGAGDSGERTGVPSGGDDSGGGGDVTLRRPGDPLSAT